MTDRETLTTELRELFGRGATVAELIRYARNAVGKDAPRIEWVGAVRKAFGLTPAGWYLPSYTEGFGAGDSPASKLTWAFLPKIMARRDVWDQPSDEPRWYDGLQKLTDAEYDAMAQKSHGISPEGWAALGERDRQEVLMLERMRLSLGEDVQLLAALAEQLQRRLNELEGQQENSNQHPASAGAA